MKINLLLATAVLLACARSASAQVTIYQDTFTGTGALNASMPTIDTGGNGGTAGAAWNADSDWTTTGSSASNTLGQGNAFLPFTPVAGQDYTLTATLSASGGSGWTALGFTDYLDSSAPGNTTPDNQPFYLNPPSASPWLLLNPNSTANTFLGYNGGSNPAGFNQVGGNDPVGQGDTYVLTLDTSTNPNDWTISMTATGPGITGTETLLGTTTLNSNIVGAIHYVALGDISGTTSTVSNFTLIDTSASSTTPTSYTVVTTPAPTVVLHQNATTTLVTTITNTGTGTADTLDYAGLGATSTLGNGISPGAASSSTPLNNGGPSASGSTASNSQTYTATNAGTDNITNTSTIGTNHTSQTAASGGYTGTTIVVYTGAGTWTGGSASWGTPVASPTNWTSPGGVPGLAGGAFTATDSATFGNTSSAVSVTLDGQSPSLNTVTFNNTSTGSYTIGKGSGGTLKLNDGSGTAAITDTAGSNTISAPVELDSNTAASVAVSTDTLTISGAISESGGSKSFSVGSGSGAVVLSNATGNTYTGGTTITGGTLYVTNGSGSGTGYGSVTVGNGSTNSGTLAGSGTIAPTSGAGVVINSGGSLYSGGVASGTPATGPGTGIVLDNTTGLGTILSVNGDTAANLTFALGSGNPTSATPSSFSNPNVSTTYLTVLGNAPGEINFSGTDSVTLVDLTNGGLSLRLGTPYLLIQAQAGGAAPGDDALYSGLVTSLNGTLNDLMMDGNGYVIGVGTVASYTPISIVELGSNGSTNLSSPNNYVGAQLYLYDGDLEVVPEPATWAVMLGGLAVLLFTQQRRRRQL